MQDDIPPASNLKVKAALFLQQLAVRTVTQYGRAKRQKNHKRRAQLTPSSKLLRAQQKKNPKFNRYRRTEHHEHTWHQTY